MAKRKAKDSSRHVKNLSQSDSDDEKRPKKQLRNSSSSSIKADINFHNDSEHLASKNTFLNIESETLPDYEKNDSHYESFESFLKAHSFVAENKDELNDNDCEENTSKDEEFVYSKKAFKRGKKLSQSYTSFEEDMDDFEENMRIISIPSKLTQVVSLQHPASLTLHGYVRVTVQLGSISIFGCKLKEEESIEVFSTHYTGWKKVSTLKSVHKTSIEAVNKKLEMLLRHEEDKDVQDFQDNIGSQTVILIVEKALLPPPLQFLELYFPNAFRVFKIGEYRNQLESMCSYEKSNVINISYDYKLIAKEVITAIKLSAAATHGPRILVYGHLNAGKSTLLRYLINATLNKQNAVYFLDTDPGQSEFTPPGVISLIKVTEPLLGPPYSHLKTPYRMIFIGSVTASTSPPMFQKSVETLIQLFNDKFPQQTLFVNTIGWLDGIGGICFENVKKSVNPTMLIELASPENCTSFVKNILPNEVTHIQIPARQPSKKLPYKARELREFALLAYFGQCQKYFMPVTYMNAFTPVCVCWDNIAVYVMGKKIPPHRLIESIHCSVVALCYVHQMFMLDSAQPELPRTLFDEPLNECIGFGLVRAADEVNHLLYIITPLSLQQLKKVNAIIKGNIILPEAVFLKQPIENVPLPFTDHSEKIMTPARKTVIPSRTPIQL